MLFCPSDPVAPPNRLPLNDLIFVEVEDGGWKVDRLLSNVVVLPKQFSSSELVSDPLASGHSVSKVMLLNNLEFTTVGLEGRK